MKSIAFALAALLFFGFSPDNINVVVWCTNGVPVPGLPIEVTDSNGTVIPDIKKTDNEGQFVIRNKDIYNAPFYMTFNAKNGSTCGQYVITLSDANDGTVVLQYYPTNLPCSCAQYTH